MKNIFTFIYAFIIVCRLSSQEPVSREVNCSQAFDLTQRFTGDTNFVLINLNPQAMCNEGHIVNIYENVELGGVNQWILVRIC